MKITQRTCRVLAIASVVVAVAVAASPAAAVNPGTWSAQADTPERLYFASVAESDGKVYAIGGSPGEEVVGTVFSYLPTPGIWWEMAPMITPRVLAAAAVFDSKIYVFGGALNTSDWTVSNAVEVYDPATNTWEAKTDMPTGYWGSSATAVNGKIYVFGGGNGDVLGDLQVYSTVQVYDPEGDSWATATDMPTARATHSSGSTDGLIYALGGSLKDKASAALEIYDPTTDTWTVAADMPTARDWFTSAGVDGKIYAFGGLAWGPEINARIIHEVEVYSTQTGTWTVSGRMPEPRFGHGSAVINDEVFLVGGADKLILYANDHVDSYNPKIHTYWTEVVAHLSGANGSIWRTDVCTANLNSGIANVDYVLHTDSSTLHHTEQIGAKQQIAIEDIVGEMGVSGKNVLEVRSDHPLRLAGRTFSEEDGGTFGQYTYFQPMDEGFAGGDLDVSLVGLRQDATFRTNLTIANTGIRKATVYVQLFQCSGGSSIGNFVVQLEPGELDQRLQVFANEGGQPNLGMGYAMFMVAEGAGVLISGSVIDTRTNDATTIRAER